MYPLPYCSSSTISLHLGLSLARKIMYTALLNWLCNMYLPLCWLFLHVFCRQVVLKWDSHCISNVVALLNSIIIKFFVFRQVVLKYEHIAVSIYCIIHHRQLFHIACILMSSRYFNNTHSHLLVSTQLSFLLALVSFWNHPHQMQLRLYVARSLFIPEGAIRIISFLMTRNT